MGGIGRPTNLEAVLKPVSGESPTRADVDSVIRNMAGVKPMDSISDDLI